FARESIIHLVVQNKTDVVEKMIMKKEMEIFEKNSEGTKEQHKKMAKVVFHDLVYLDREEPKISNFFKKLYKNWVFTELLICVFQAISAGVVEYEYHHFWTEQFANPYMIDVIQV
ncbi:hypothetical protein PMAYCL1PPCAC_05336, partial [Pristionchus mayeri]